MRQQAARRASACPTITPLPAAGPMVPAAATRAVIWPAVPSKGLAFCRPPGFGTVGERWSASTGTPTSGRVSWPTTAAAATTPRATSRSTCAGSWCASPTKTTPPAARHQARADLHHLREFITIELKEGLKFIAGRQATSHVGKGGDLRRGKGGDRELRLMVEDDA